MPVIPRAGDWEEDQVTIPVGEYIKLIQQNEFLKYMKEVLGPEFDEAVKAWREQT